MVRCTLINCDCSKSLPFSPFPTRTHTPFRPKDERTTERGQVPGHHQPPTQAISLGNAPRTCQKRIADPSAYTYACPSKDASVLCLNGVRNPTSLAKSGNGCELVREDAPPRAILHINATDHSPLLSCATKAPAFPDNPLALTNEEEKRKEKKKELVERQSRSKKESWAPASRSRRNFLLTADSAAAGHLDLYVTIGTWTALFCQLLCDTLPPPRKRETTDVPTM